MLSVSQLGGSGGVGAAVAGSSSNGSSSTAAAAASAAASAQLRQKYMDIIDHGNKHPQTVQQNLHLLRKTILMEGLPLESEEEIKDRRSDSSSQCSLRGLVWKILLGIRDLEPDRYLELLERGQSDQYQKIRKDISRTFMKDAEFSQSVSQDKLSRCLNAFVHSCQERGSNISYVQGMNVICGAFLYVLPELDAFNCFQTLVYQYCYLYLEPKISGVHTALKILDTVLEFVDPELFGYLKSKSYDSVLLTHAILSIGTSTPPLGELLHLWDFYFAFGIHLNVISTISRLLLMRDTLLAHPSPCSLFRSLPDLDAETIINLSLSIIRQLPDELYELLVDHPVFEISGTSQEEEY
ncbi:RabGAP/TBC domain-containing protein [Cavenderia fasciculata]|uniref:RabGAP/TBC domain-containing protein n=1 Tax=Cavenderia fasciculata TaxID=261658 RepID=F4PKU2_CACFS|nr:RabGAP/TBC domain-containing protein [Cavenderia fasciculata]EGG24216.1 RabGAP/TBC domain-containing protein [Cavenderia fasciculata]|eukprot:XP_004362067.1 RabGAP/TBC domain-containing protein [Cavenderia fasciculata]